MNKLVFLFLILSISLYGDSSVAKLALMHKYEHACNTPSDINEHVPILRARAMECSSLVEIGLRNMVSSWGILQGLSESSSTSRSYLGIDINTPESEILYLAIGLAEDNGISFNFCEANDMNVDIEASEMLFIDSLHTYLHLTYELEKFSPKIGKYIVMHDTSTSWGYDDEPNPLGDSIYPAEYDRAKKGLWQAVEDFLERHPEWTLFEHRLNNHGLTTLKRIMN
jgi:cephalosporin hydroxylase